MAENIVKLLEDRLRDRPMKTVDPNTQAAGDEQTQSPKALYHRAVMSAALAGLLEFSRKDQNMRELLSNHSDRDYSQRVFHHHFSELEDRIRTYSGYSGGHPKEDFNFVLQELVDIVGAHAAGDARAAKDFLSNQRANIVSYLPGDLHTGKLLNNSAIDDRTNKMHGPFSDFTHWMERIFSTSDQ
ncbi:hypothetical protein [Arachidicoccus terrestris]|uniref:hypothetical protein n=1 Tax=Arachidicoccus terrestris TaxID=2875539 RepID=UPI001CC502C7|nr:hypothetical protein [Arachidicoccus terrestris]UAY55909.1 hypothetical protein K9M52_02430 [Arachidicoccus terrestris]